MPNPIHRLTATAKRDAKRLATKLEKGEITAKEFEVGMSELLTSSHIVAASVGRGGIDKMDASDWQKVKLKIEWQEGYLAKWVRKIARVGVVGSIVSRAYRYLSAPFISFSSASFKSQTLQGPGLAGKEKHPGGGGTIPKDARIPTLARLVQNSKEGCEECIADAAEGWIPVEEMGEIGSRICGDYCLCEIEFSNES